LEITYEAPDARMTLERDFEARFQAVRPRLLRICAAVVGPDDAEDLVQETYMRAMERLDQLRNPALLEAWLVRVALNESRTLRRRQARLRLRLPHLVQPQAASPDTHLQQLVDDLPARERACVVLHYGYGYRLAEVGELLGVSALNARTILFRARRRLRRQLEEAES
jgi:RNA polymerase sigma factor (sigma-70 family)